MWFHKSLWSTLIPIGKSPDCPWSWGLTSEISEFFSPCTSPGLLIEWGTLDDVWGSSNLEFPNSYVKAGIPFHARGQLASPWGHPCPPRGQEYVLLTLCQRLDDLPVSV
jgi:hypothetical protein